jgi:hypothetical protein
MNATILSADAADNKADLAVYVAAKLKHSLPRNDDPASDSRYSYVLEAAQGNFLIAKALTDEIEEGNLRPEDLASIQLKGGTSRLPPGLQLFFERSFVRLFPSDQDFAPARMVLALALAALEPLDLPILQAASGIEKAKLGFILKKLATFLPLRADGRFVFFHKSLHDWLDVRTVDLLGEPIAKDFAIDVEVGRQNLVKWGAACISGRLLFGTPLRTTSLGFAPNRNRGP